VNTSRQNPNLARLAAAAAKLEPLLGQIAFVGGCVTGLLLTDPAAAAIRPTLDVDAIIAIAPTLSSLSSRNACASLAFTNLRLKVHRFVVG
jgi:hypothetical protein